jgi:CheY-like chemotaxis protein
LKVNKIDIVLMDLKMPVMDGCEATIAIRNGRAENAHSIIAVTADVMETQITCRRNRNEPLFKPN